MEIKKEIKNGVGILKASGESLIYDEKKFSELLLKIGEKTAFQVILDLENVIYLDSGFIGSIILSNKLCNDRKGRFVISSVNNGNLIKFFQTARVYDLIEFYDNLIDALESFKN